MSKSKWLASVKSLAEAQALASSLPDILDMKQPAEGALGALAVDTVAEIVNWLQGRCLSSATVGDLPMQVEVIAPALAAMAETGVDFVKLGLFGGVEQQQCLHALSPVLQRLKTPVIAVIFADKTQDLSVVSVVKDTGFHGVMVDTATKTGATLRHCWSPALLAQFVDEAKAQNLLCGLAGALRIEDIPELSVLQPDYLGFRSALCPDRQRKDLLSAKLAENIKQAMG